MWSSLKILSLMMQSSNALLKMAPSFLQRKSWLFGSKEPVQLKHLHVELLIVLDKTSILGVQTVVGSQAEHAIKVLRRIGGRSEDDHADLELLGDLVDVAGESLAPDASNFHLLQLQKLKKKEL